ncbi:MAG: T9SS type A sorting domain-containing protein [Chitinophagales bacterium]|nr:T9SS type A sorting domain-containing protein [Chitinophagales bacterium]
MKKMLLLLFCFVTLVSFAQTNIVDSFLVDGVYRNYILHVPTGYSGATQHPLVLNLHGYTSNASQEQLYTQMDVTADANGFLVVYPNGISNYWNSFGAGANDVKFLDSLIERIKRSYTIDTKCIYSCGMSNGGFMSYTLACQLSHKIAAVASVTGVISNNTLANCALTHKVPVLQIHGTADPTVNYSTGVANAVGVEATLAFWLDTNNCLLVSDTTNIPNTNLADGCTAQLIRYQTCEQNAEVYFYKIAGGGHTWPGGSVTVGVTNRDFNASTEIWNFFKRHKLNTSVGIENNSPKTLNAFPNPFDNVITLQLTSPHDVVLFNAQGKMVFEAKQQKQTVSINTTELPAGVYFLVTDDHNAPKSVKKLIK